MMEGQMCFGPALSSTDIVTRASGPQGGKQGGWFGYSWVPSQTAGDIPGRCLYEWCQYGLKRSEEENR